MVQQPSRSIAENQQKARQHTKQQEATQKPNKPNNTHQKQATWKVIGGPVQRLLMKVRWQHVYNSGIGMAENKTKEKTENTTNTSPYRRVSEATQHYAETRDPPSQDPRDRASHQA